MGCFQGSLLRLVSIENRLSVRLGRIGSRFPPDNSPMRISRGNFGAFGRNLVGRSRILPFVCEGVIPVDPPGRRRRIPYRGMRTGGGFRIDALAMGGEVGIQF